MSTTDFVGWMLLAIGLGAVVGILAGYGRGFQVFRKQLHEHMIGIEALHAPMREENERLRGEINSIGAANERLARENHRYERTLAEWADEITGLHHALDAQAEANLMIDREIEREIEEERHATVPRRVTKLTPRKQQASPRPRQ